MSPPDQGAEIDELAQHVGTVLGLVEQTGVGHGLGGDLSQALQQLDARELAGVAVEQHDQADDLAAHDQRQADARHVARLQERARSCGLRLSSAEAS